MPKLSEEENYQETKKYMSEPSRVGDLYCPPHLSGGAIDLTLFDVTEKKSINLGTVFDDCSIRAHANYFNTLTALSTEEAEIKKHRNLLTFAMEEVGFTSYEYEWWHFDIGNIFWSKKLNTAPIFGPLFGNKEWPSDEVFYK